MPLANWSPVDLAQRRALMPQGEHDAFSANVLDIVAFEKTDQVALQRFVVHGSVLQSQGARRRHMS